MVNYEYGAHACRHAHLWLRHENLQENGDMREESFKD